MTDKEQEKVKYTRPKDEGEVDSRRLAAVMGAAGTATIIALVTMLSIGMVGAALGVGIGGFVANFDNVSYNDNDAEIYPSLGENPACTNAPQIEANLGGQAKLYQGVEFYKDLPLPSDFAGNQFARVSIVASAPASGITVQDLNLRLSALETKQLNLSNADIAENAYANTSNNLSDTGSASDAYSNATRGAGGAEFGITADSFNLPQGGSAAAHSVSFQSISLQNLDLFVQILNETNASANGPVYRAINPSERDCASLAQNSKVNNATDLTTADGGTDFAT